MVTKETLWNTYNNEMISHIITRFGDENGELIDLSQKLFGNVVYITESEAHDMIRMGVEQLSKDIESKIVRIDAAMNKLEDAEENKTLDKDVVDISITALLQYKRDLKEKKESTEEAHYMNSPDGELIY